MTDAMQEYDFGSRAFVLGLARLLWLALRAAVRMDEIDEDLHTQ